MRVDKKEFKERINKAKSGNKSKLTGYDSALMQYKLLYNQGRISALDLLEFVIDLKRRYGVKP